MAAAGNPSLEHPRPSIGDRRFFAAADVGALLDEQRKACPVEWAPDGPFWVLTRHQDVTEVSRDPTRFCSSKGVLISEVLARWPEYRLAGPPVPAPSTLVRQVAAVPVILHP